MIFPQATSMFDVQDDKKTHQLENSYRFYFVTKNDSDDGSIVDKTIDDLFSTGTLTLILLSSDVFLILYFSFTGSFGTVEQFW